MSEEFLDIENPGDLIGYLRETGRVRENEELRVRVLAGGVSNRTMLVERSASDESWVVKQALAKLRVEVEWFSDPERIYREALGLRWLEKIAPAGKITPLVFEDHANHLLAMQAVPEPHENWKNMLLEGRVEKGHVEQFGRLLGVIHREGYELRDELAGLFRDRSFFESLRLEPYYGYAGECVSEASSFLYALMEETRAHRDTLVHGDYSPKNVLVRDGELILLDHEVIHFGDPAFDLGFSLTHLLSKAHHVPDKRSDFADAARLHWSAYGEEIENVPWEDGLERRAVRHTLGCLLARVSGRSPLEYLSESERDLQREVVLALIRDRPESISELVESFLERL